MTGPLHGLLVVELASEYGAFAGRMLAELGADVVLVEPKGGHHTRRYEPFVDDVPDPERSLWWWHYNAAKSGVELDWAGHDRDALRRLLVGADVVLEAEVPGALAALGLDYDDIRADAPRLIWASVTPYGRANVAGDVATTDLTILAGAGPVWSCGYDDHWLPPVRGGGNQAAHTACVWAVMAILVAYLAREAGADGQFVDVNMHAASNVTTESATQWWLTNGGTVQRQTGRHAQVSPTVDRMALAADRRHVSTGVPPRTADEFGRLIAWMEELGVTDEFPDFPVLQLGLGYPDLSPAVMDQDELAVEVYRAGADAVIFLAGRMSAYDFFRGAQERGLSAGVIYTPDEVLTDPHFEARGFLVPVEHPSIGRTIVQPGAPYRFSRTPWATHPAPSLGEHNDVVLAALDR